MLLIGGVFLAWIMETVMMMEVDKEGHILSGSHSGQTLWSAFPSIDHDHWLRNVRSTLFIFQYSVDPSSADHHWQCQGNWDVSTSYASPGRVLLTVRKTK